MYPRQPNSSPNVDTQLTKVPTVAATKNGLYRGQWKKEKTRLWDRGFSSVLYEVDYVGASIRQSDCLPQPMVSLNPDPFRAAFYLSGCAGSWPNG